MRKIITTVMCLTALTVATAAWSAVKKAEKPKRPVAAKVPPKEQLSCRTGPNDEQARLTVVVIKGRPTEFADHSRVGTRVCSIYGKRGDAFTKWKDADGKADVALLEGSAALEYQPGHIKLTFTGVDRMQYCGMYGELNGVVEMVKEKSECKLEHVFENEKGNQDGD